MIAAFTGLLACQLIGEILVRALSLPLPGPVAGLGLMFGFLMWRGRHRMDADAIPSDLGRAADGLLGNLSLLFIPASVGVIQYLGLLRQYAGQIAIAIAVSTTLALAVTALTFRFVARLHAFRRKPLGERVETALDTEHHP